jgi:hypothetical protein
MTIEPISRTVTVKVSPSRAFDIFVGHMGAWWPKGRTVGESPHADIIVEPRPGGRWYEKAKDGAQTDWGKVLEWLPPKRLLLGWQLGPDFRFDPDLLTEVELRFEEIDGGCKVTLEHRKLELFGDSAERMAGLLGGGWPGFLQHFVDYAEVEG